MRSMGCHFVPECSHAQKVILVFFFCHICGNMVIWDPVILLPWQLDVTTSPHYFPKTNFSTRLTHPSVFPRRTAFAQPRKTFQFWRNETAAHFSCMPGACVKQLRLWCFLRGCWLQQPRERFFLYPLLSGILWFLQNHFQFFPRMILRNQYFHPPELRYWSHLASKRKTKNTSLRFT